MANNVNKPAANTMRAEEFNRRWEAVWLRVEKHLTTSTQAEGYMEEVKAIATELYLLQQELPPASKRYHLADDMIENLGRENVSTVAATDTKAVKKLVWADTKLRPEQRASRGRTYKTSPQDRAEARLQAVYASYNAHHDALQAAKRQLVQAEADFKAAHDKLIAVSQEVKALKPQRGGTQKAAPAAGKAPAKAPATRATPKGELSPAMVQVLEAIAHGKQAVKGLTPQQFSAARMHLAMRGMVAKDAKGTYKVTKPTAKK